MTQEIWITYALLFLIFHSCSAKQSTTLTIINKCNDIIWPALLSTGGAPPWLPETNFLQLRPGDSKTLSLPSSWTGRLWGQSLCNRASGSSTTAGTFSCATGNCSPAGCSTGGTTATLVEFTLNGGTGAGMLDAYLVSLVHGFNLPMAVVPQGGTAGNCTESGCFVDLNENCPQELRMVYGARTVGCRSACETFGEPYYCCTAWKNGDSAVTGNCKAKSYSNFFGGLCPLGSVTFTCASKDYIVTFCPSSTPSTRMSSNEFESEDGTEIYDSDEKSNRKVLVGVGIFLGVLAALLAFVVTVWKRCGKEAGVLDQLNLQQCSCQCIVINGVKVG